MNKPHQLHDVLSVRELLASKDEHYLKVVMKTNISSLPVELDQEDAAKVFMNEDLISIFQLQLNQIKSLVLFM